VSDLPSVPDYFGQFMAPLQRQQQIDINRQQVQAEEAQVYQRAAEQQAKLHQQQMFQSDAQSVISNPTPEGYRSLMLKYPSEHEGIKAAWDQQSEGQRQRDTEAASQVYAALSNGRSDLALSLLKDRQAALKNGGEDDKVTDSIIDMISSGDPAKVKQAQGIAGFVLANAAGPDKIGSTLQALGQQGGDYTLGPGMKRFNAQNEVVAEARTRRSTATLRRSALTASRSPRSFALAAMDSRCQQPTPEALAGSRTPLQRCSRTKAATRRRT
jgi:hypothetical protein